MIHPSAIIAPSAKLGARVAIGPYAIIEADTVLGDDCRIAGHAVIKRHTTLGDGVRVDHFSVIGGDPQDHSFDSGLVSGVRIGARTVIREQVTVHRATKAGEETRIGEDCLLMATSHVAHDCVVGHHVILANSALLAGHVQVADRAFISGGAVVHQFCRIGGGALISGNGIVSHDVPPNTLVHARNVVAGLNLVGLRRRGLSLEAIEQLKHAYHEVYADATNCATQAKQALASGRFAHPEAVAFLEFFLGGKRGRFASPE